MSNVEIKTVKTEMINKIMAQTELLGYSNVIQTFSLKFLQFLTSLKLLAFIFFLNDSICILISLFSSNFSTKLN